MQKTARPPQHHFDRPSASGLGKLQVPAKTTKKPMVYPSSTTKKPAYSNAVGGAFGHSKFFLKKQNAAAKKIQSLIRAFLVQARLYRQRVLEPRRQELQDVEDRKAEELRRIQVQLEEEKKALPAMMKQEMMASEEEADLLKLEIEDYTKANEALKQERKEEKRKHKAAMGSALLSVYFILSLLMPVILALLYLLKSFLGVDIFPDMHVQDFFSYAESVKRTPRHQN